MLMGPDRETRAFTGFAINPFLQHRFWLRLRPRRWRSASLGLLSNPTSGFKNRREKPFLGVYFVNFVGL